jgi:hypothetical protein
MIVYHRTTEENAADILEAGFADSTGSDLTEKDTAGVWISDSPLDRKEAGDVLLRIKLDATHSDLADFEWVEQGESYREWLVPAVLLNDRGVVEVCDEGALRTMDGRSSS